MVLIVTVHMPNSIAEAAKCLQRVATSRYLPRKVDDECRQEPRWISDRRALAEARSDLAAGIVLQNLTYITFVEGGSYDGAPEKVVCGPGPC